MDEPRILVDTSAWVEALRGRRREMTEAVLDQLNRDRVVTCDVVVAELRVGLREQERARVLGLLDAVPRVGVDASDWDEAGDLGARLRARGVTLPLTDLLIARVCLRHGFELLASDDHFRSVDGLVLHSV